MLNLQGKTPEQLRRERTVEQLNKLWGAILMLAQMYVLSAALSGGMAVLASRWPQVPTFGWWDTFAVVAAAASVVWLARIVWGLGR